MNTASDPRSTAVLCAVAMVGLASVIESPLAARTLGDGGAFLERVIAETTRSGFTVTATRDLRAGAADGKHEGWMAVETVQRSGGEFTWRVLNEGGSERTRSKVFREFLNAEAQAWRAGAKDAAALTPANYDFVPLPPSADGRVRIQLKPKRQDSRLVDGTLTVSADGSPLLLEGRLAKSPSFWVRSVSIVKRFARIGGIALPTSIESTADVKLVGRAIFSMRYAYREVNGRAVQTPAHSLPAPRATYSLAMRPESN